MEITYDKATDLDYAWLNFELDLPLPPSPDGRENPFYVPRPGDPTSELEYNLLAPFRIPPKFFFSGHRGCGKSTELLRLSQNPDILKKYWPIHFSIRDEGDINDLDFRDILIGMGSQMYRQYTKSHKLDPQLLRELESWQHELVEETETITKGRRNWEINGGIDGVFANMSLRMKLEPETRTVLREIVQRNITKLLSVINEIAQAIYVQQKRWPLILIDDLDKPTLEQARAIFFSRREIMMQPHCAVVYTVSSALFYSPDFEAIRDHAVFLPNIKLYNKGHQLGDNQPKQRDQIGYDTLKQAIYQRMDESLIEEAALEAIIDYSGGVFRELSRLMRAAINRSRRNKENRLHKEAVEIAATDIRNEYRRILTSEDLRFLNERRQDNRLHNHPLLRPLLQMLALLEYRNGENWCAIHPTLELLLLSLTPAELQKLSSQGS